MHQTYIKDLLEHVNLNSTGIILDLWNMPEKNNMIVFQI
ncbi:hypothetical protein ACUIJN_09255 [Metabacillus halosaccharovorans]